MIVSNFKCLSRVKNIKNIHLALVFFIIYKFTPDDSVDLFC